MERKQEGKKEEKKERKKEGREERKEERKKERKRNPWRGLEAGPPPPETKVPGIYGLKIGCRNGSCWEAQARDTTDKEIAPETLESFGHWT